MLLPRMFDLENATMYDNLQDFIDQNRQPPLITDSGYNQISTDDRMFRLNYELTIFWTVYHFEERIQDLVAIDNVIENVLLTPMTFQQIEDYLRNFLGGVTNESNK